jgi:hypothetical protein
VQISNPAIPQQPGFRFITGHPENRQLFGSCCPVLFRKAPQDSHDLVVISGSRSSWPCASIYVTDHPEHPPTFWLRFSGSPVPKALHDSHDPVVISGSRSSWPCASIYITDHAEHGPTCRLLFSVCVPKASQSSNDRI